MFIQKIVYQKIKDEGYVISLGDYHRVGSHWIPICVNDKVTYFDSFGVILKIAKNPNVTEINITCFNDLQIFDKKKQKKMLKQQ